MSTENQQKDNKDDIDLNELDKIKEDERRFWKEYGDFIMTDDGKRLLRIPYYQRELKMIKELINIKNGERWLDLGCGALPISEMILDLSKGKKIELYAADINLEPAKKRLQ
ncbi:MAG: hypothetical protein PHO28_04050 [Candidatus Pacebacteria bacterium]|nr:hypothetical protein [Candidatus Paceibacterota bacterium]